jgi:hypothetical protein
LDDDTVAGEQLMATPVVDGKALYIRTEKHLYRIQDPSG